MDINALSEVAQDWDIENEGYEHQEPPESRWLFSLCTDYLNMSDETSPSGIGLQPETHTECCAFIEEAVGDFKFHSEIQKLYMMLMPRGTFKSSILVGSCIGIIKENPNIRILWVTHKQKVSQGRLRVIKFHLTNNPEFLERYGDGWRPDFHSGLPWSDGQITVAKRTATLIEPTVDTGSLGADLTSTHYDLIIADDLVNEKNVVTVELRDQVADYLDTLQSMLDPRGTIIVTGTRWHVDDAFGRIIKDDDQRIAEGKPERYKKYIRSCWDGPQGLFFPAWQSFEFLESIRNRPGKARYFAANYENKPVADEDRVFDMSRVNIMDFELYKVNNSNIIRISSQEQYPISVTMAWDPAGINPHRKSDYHGITVVGTDFADRWWVLVASQWKGKPTEILDRICSQIAYYAPDKIIIESVGGYVLWIPLLQRALREKGLSVAIDEDNTGGQNKSTRIQMLEPRCSSGRMYLLPHQKALIEQMTNFSSANELVHEDILDSLAKHEGRTRPAGQRIPEPQDIFEIDEDYMQYVREQAGEDKQQRKKVSAGSFGMKWKV